LKDTLKDAYGLFGGLRWLEDEPPDDGNRKQRSFRGRGFQPAGKSTTTTESEKKVGLRKKPVSDPTETGF
jgi:hypothetical protein